MTLMPSPAATAAQSTHHWQTRHWHTDTRYYTAEIIQDLFGDWVLRRSWGSRTTKRGNTKDLHAATYAEALTLLEYTHKRRIQRGYWPS